MSDKSTEEEDLKAWAAREVDGFGYLWGSNLKDLTEGAVLAEVLRRTNDFKFRSTSGFKLAFWCLVFCSLILVPLNFFRDLPSRIVDSSVGMVSILLIATLVGCIMMIWSALRWNPSKQPGWDSICWEVDQALWQEIEARRSQLLSSDGSSTYGSPPLPVPYGVSHVGAESLCAAWMMFLGETNVSVTPATSDGGIDIVSDLSVAQVKNYSGSVGVAPLRELAGVAMVDGRRPIFFTSGTYTEGAVEFSERAKMVIYIYNAEKGTLDPANKLAKESLKKIRKMGSSTQSKSGESDLVPGNFRPRVRSAPAHCPKCDYAPAPEEERCSECGFYFQLNRF